MPPLVHHLAGESPAPSILMNSPSRSEGPRWPGDHCQELQMWQQLACSSSSRPVPESYLRQNKPCGLKPGAPASGKQTSGPGVGGHAPGRGLGMMALRSQKKIETQGFRIGTTLLKALFPEALHPSAKPRPSRTTEAHSAGAGPTEPSVELGWRSGPGMGGTSAMRSLIFNLGGRVWPVAAGTLPAHACHGTSKERG